MGMLLLYINMKDTMLYHLHLPMNLRLMYTRKMPCTNAMNNNMMHMDVGMLSPT